MMIVKNIGSESHNCQFEDVIWKCTHRRERSLLIGTDGQTNKRI